MEQTTFESLSPKVSELARLTALGVCSNAADAEDVAQDVMLKLWTMHALIGDEAEMLRLATVMGRRIAIDLWRRNRRMTLTDELKEPMAFARSPQEEMEHREADEWLLKRMEALPPAEFQILRMRQVEEKSNAEIARILQIKPQSVATLLARARHKMLEQMKQKRLNNR